MRSYFCNLRIQIVNIVLLFRRRRSAEICAIGYNITLEISNEIELSSNELCIDLGVVSHVTSKITATITYNIQPQNRSECIVNFAVSNNTTQREFGAFGNILLTPNALILRNMQNNKTRLTVFYSVEIVLKQSYNVGS